MRRRILALEEEDTCSRKTQRATLRGTQRGTQRVAGAGAELRLATVRRRIHAAGAGAELRLERADERLGFRVQGLGFRV
jgi:hypothetical protein